MPWIIAAATLAATAYGAYEQRKAQDAARAEASRAAQQASEAASAARAQAEQQLGIQREQAAAQREQASVIRQRLDAELKKNSEDKARLEAQAKQQADQLEAERRDLAEKESARIRSVRRSGRRSLMSDVRLAPETGIMSGSDTAMSDSTTLGVGGVTLQ